MKAVVPGVDVLRVTVVRGHRRVDVAVAVGVPVAELLPDLARTLRVDVEGCLLASVLGEPFDGHLGLGPQGVVDGQVLTLLDAEGSDARYDDLAQAVGEVTSPEVARWGREHARTTVWLLLVGLVALVAVLAPFASRALSAAVGVLCVAGVTVAVVVAQRHGRVGPWVWPAVAVAGWHVVLLGAAVPAGGVGEAAGSLVQDSGLGPVMGLGQDSVPSVTAAGVALVVWGIVLLACLSRAREWCVIPLTAGSFAVAAGAVATLLDTDPGLVVWAVVSVVLLLQRWVPLALVDMFLVPDAPVAVRGARVRADITVVHRLVTGAAVVVVLGCVVVTPYAVLHGPWGQGWVVGVCLALLLRARHQQLRDHVAVAVAGTFAVVSVAAVATAVVGEGGRSVGGATDVVLVSMGLAAAAVLWASAPSTVRPSGVRWGWWGDQVERLALALLVPCWLVGSGLVSDPTGWFT